MATLGDSATQVPLTKTTDYILTSIFNMRVILCYYMHVLSWLVKDAGNMWPTLTPQLSWAKYGPRLSYL